MKKVLTLMIVFYCSGVVGQSLSTANYTEDTGIVLNPERGFYKHTDSHNGWPSVFVNTYVPLTSGELDSYLSDNMSLILRLFYIHAFATVDTISQDYKNKMQADFDLLRQKGMKAIVRFAYSNIQDSLDLNVTPERITSHLESVKSVLAANQDVILVVQGGLIGTWGEWYYTDNFGNAGVVSESEYIKRFEVITALLDNVPPGIMIQLRTPDYKRRYLEYIGESTSAVSAAEAYNPALVKARLGHHNDCILSTPDGRVHEVTIPKSTLGTLSDTISIGYRGIQNNALWAGSSQSQLPQQSEGLASCILGSQSITGGWETVPDVVAFANGTVQELKLADDATNIYIRVKESGYLANGKDRYEIFLNTDNDTATGWIDASAWSSSGADYLLQKPLDLSNTLYVHAGGGNGWSWTQVVNPGITATLEYTDSFDDQGTFVTTNDIGYVADDSYYVIQGGETCLPTQQNDCDKSETRLALHKYTYLNSLYHPDVIDKWDTQSCIDDISKSLGYRIHLNSVSVQDQVAAGNKLFVSVDLTNSGYAAPSRLRPLYLIMRDTVTLSEYSIAFQSTASDVRSWLSGNTVFNESLIIPSTIPVGTYELLLSLPDAASTLSSNTNYSIRFANQNTWESTTGYNQLGLYTQVQAAVTPSTPIIVVDGSLTDWSDVDALGLGNGNVSNVKAHDIADTLFVSASGTFGNGYNLYIDADGLSYTGYAGWATGADYKVSADKIYRFEFEESWVEIGDSLSYSQNAGAFEVAIPKSLLYGLDETVKLGYENLVSGVSSGRAPAAGNLFSFVLDFMIEVPRPQVTITADGNTADWAYIDPLAESSGDLKLLKAYDDQTNVYLSIKGSLTNVNANYQVFLNTDNNTLTGLVDPGFWSSTGADYAIIGGALYQHDSVTSKANNSGNPNAWAWTLSSASLTIQTSSDSSTRELVIPKSLLNELAEGSQIEVGYRKLSGNTVLAKLPSSGGLVRYTIETPFVEDLQSLIISDDVIDLTLTVEGGVITNTYEALLDSDNNASTGYGDGASIVGADFLIQNGILYSYGGDGVSWVWNASGISIVVSDTAVDAHVSQRKISIPKAALSLTSSGDTVNIVYKSTVNWVETARLPVSGMQTYETVKDYIPELQVYEVTDDGTNLYLAVEGSNVLTNYEAFINIDNDSTTGFIDATWTSMGADYLIKDGLLYIYSGTSNQWGWTNVSSAISVTNTIISADTKKRLIAIPRVSLTALNAGDIITSGYRNILGTSLGAYIPGTGAMKPDTVDYNYVPDLQQLVVSDDADSLYVVVTGGTLASTYDLYINTDEDAASGYLVSAWSSSGADLLLQNGTLYDYSGTNNQWGWTASSSGVVVQDTDLGGGTYERRMAIPRTVIPTTSLTVKLGYGNTSGGNITAQLPAEGAMQSFTLTPFELTIGEVGKINNDQTDGFEWTTVTLVNTYSEPVVIMSPLSYNGRNPATIRVKDVTSNSFKYQIDEWDYLDGAHVEESFYYLAVEAGVYELDGGVILQAGNTSVNHQWSDIAFTEEFTCVPLVFAQATTVNESSAVSGRIRYIGTSQFELKVQEEEGSDQTHAMENVAWLALTEGYGNVGRTYEVDGTDRLYDHIFFEKYFTNSYDDPILFANMQTAYGKDACALRYDDLGSDVVYFKVEEEKSADFETNHTNEEIGFLVFDSAGVIKGKEIHQAVARTDNPAVQMIDELLSDESSFNYNIYPNPVSDKLYVDLDLPNSTELSIRLYGLDGRVHYDWEGLLESGNHFHEIETGGLPKGMQVLKVVFDQQSFSVKVIVR